MRGDGEELRLVGGGLLKAFVQGGERQRRLLAFVLCPALLGAVAGDLGESDVLADVVVDGGDHDVGPVARAVLAIPPALLLVAALAHGDLQLLLRMPLGLALDGVEDAEVLPDDLAAGVARDPLRAGVPAGDVALGIEHEDRVVADGLHEEPEPFLALPQGLLRLAVGGDVARDLGEPEVLPRVVEDGRDEHVRPEPAAVLADAPAFL